MAGYLLREGTEALASDWVHMRTCLHYAAMGGQTDCLRLLVSNNTQVRTKDGYRALRDVVVQDIQVETCRCVLVLLIPLFLKSGCSCLIIGRHIEVWWCCCPGCVCLML